MGFLDSLFGKKTPPAPKTRVEELVAAPPRLINEGPEFPNEPIVLRREVTQAEVERALTDAGFSRANETTWQRGPTTIEQRAAHGVSALAFSGEDIVDAQRQVLATLAWINPLLGFYEAMRDSRTPVVELQYLLGALANYRCAGGVPSELRVHVSPEIKEAVRLIDRERQAEAARAQRARKGR